eukprot:6199828-Pleurochrysis_carterae.AAC.1
MGPEVHLLLGIQLVHPLYILHSKVFAFSLTALAEEKIFAAFSAIFKFFACSRVSRLPGTRASSYIFMVAWSGNTIRNDLDG